MQITPNFDWTDASILVLRQGLVEGLSCAQIGVGLGCSRNAVIGKLHRLGLSSPRVKARVRPEPKPRRSVRIGLPRYKPPTAPQEAMEPAMEINDTSDQDIPIAQRRTLMELENHHCRWPVNSPGAPDFFYCGDPSADVNDGRPYCAAHARRAYQAAQPRRRTAYSLPRRAA